MEEIENRITGLYAEFKDNYERGFKSEAASRRARNNALALMKEFKAFRKASMQVSAERKAAKCESKHEA